MLTVMLYAYQGRIAVMCLAIMCFVEIFQTLFYFTAETCILYTCYQRLVATHPWAISLTTTVQLQVWGVGRRYEL